MKQAKNMAEFKRMIKPGVLMHAVYHLAFVSRDPGDPSQIILGDNDLGVRPVVTVIGSAWTLRQPDGHKHAGEESWMQFGRASEWEFTPGGATWYDTHRNQRRKGLTYRFVEAPNGTQKEGA